LKNSGLDQYGAKLFEQRQFAAAVVEGVNVWNRRLWPVIFGARCGKIRTKPHVAAGS